MHSQLKLGVAASLLHAPPPILQQGEQINGNETIQCGKIVLNQGKKSRNWSFSSCLTVKNGVTQEIVV